MNYGIFLGTNPEHSNILPQFSRIFHALSNLCPGTVPRVVLQVDVERISGGRHGADVVRAERVEALARLPESLSAALLAATDERLVDDGEVDDLAGGSHLGLISIGIVGLIIVDFLNSSIVSNISLQ